jgi:hypothetical protein
MPGMIRPRRLDEPDLADDLRPHVQGGAGLFPFREWEGRPCILRRGHELEVERVVLNALARKCGFAARLFYARYGFSDYLAPSATDFSIVFRHGGQVGEADPPSPDQRFSKPFHDWQPL